MTGTVSIGLFALALTVTGCLAAISEVKNNNPVTQKPGRFLSLPVPQKCSQSESVLLTTKFLTERKLCRLMFPIKNLLVFGSIRERFVLFFSSLLLQKHRIDVLLSIRNLPKYTVYICINVRIKIKTGEKRICLDVKKKTKT